MKAKKNLFGLSMMLLAVALFTSPLKAQVNIGSENSPKSFSLLELTTEIKKGGLRMPQLKTAQRNALNLTSNAVILLILSRLRTDSTAQFPALIMAMVRYLMMALLVMVSSLLVQLQAATGAMVVTTFGVTFTLLALTLPFLIPIGLVRLITPVPQVGVFLPSLTSLICT